MLNPQKILFGLGNVDFDSFLGRNRGIILAFFLGLILIGLGALIYRNNGFPQNNKIQVLETAIESQGEDSTIVVEIAGGVESPGVYKLARNSRVEDLLISSGGFSGNADRDWVSRNLNRAAKLSDGQKVFIPNKTINGKLITNNFSDSGGVVKSNLININTATLKELDSLPGIGQVYGQNIIEHRPYSNVEELLKNGVLKTSVYEKIKDLITAY